MIFIILKTDELFTVSEGTTPRDDLLHNVCGSYPAHSIEC